MTKSLVLTVGLPRSGKTSWIRNFVEHEGQPIGIVCPDDIRKAMYGERFIKGMEPFVWAVVPVVIRSMFMSVYDIVVLDATSITRASRDKWQSPGEWDTYFKLIDTPPSECIDRSFKVDGGYHKTMKGVIERMAEQFEDLGTDEKRWKG